MMGQREGTVVLLVCRIYTKKVVLRLNQPFFVPFYFAITIRLLLKYGF